MNNTLPQIDERFLKAQGKFVFDDAAVGALALISMYQTVTFLLLQLLLFIPLSVLSIILEQKGWSQNSIDNANLIMFIILELPLIIFLVKRGKKNFDLYKKFRLNDTAVKIPDKIKNIDASIKESYLEKLFFVVALAGIGWCTLLGLNTNSLKIMMSILEAGVLLFLLIFITTRYLVTKQIRLSAIACLLITSISFWLYLI